MEMIVLDRISDYSSVMQPLEYFELKSKLIEAGYHAEIYWAETVQAPETAEDLFRQYGWVVVNSGMKNQVAEKIWAKIQAAIAAGKPVSSVFKHPGKAAAIQSGWDDRNRRLKEFQAVKDEDQEQVLDWLRGLPWIGQITCWHLAKNLGIDCAKPDRWLERVAAASDESVAGLCSRLADQSGDRVATVDLVIWRACNLGLWPAAPAADAIGEDGRVAEAAV